jgi:RHS repeat-associated protein
MSSRFFYEHSQRVAEISELQNYRHFKVGAMPLGGIQSAATFKVVECMVFGQSHSVFGTFKVRLAYTPYGYAPSGDHSFLIRFNGEDNDSVSGCYLLGNGRRCYSPSLRRFYSADKLSPFGAGGVNAYAYCQGDPVNNVDPSGAVPQFLTDIYRSVRGAYNYLLPYGVDGYERRHRWGVYYRYLKSGIDGLDMFDRQALLDSGVLSGSDWRKFTESALKYLKGSESSLADVVSRDCDALYVVSDVRRGRSRSSGGLASRSVSRAAIEQNTDNFAVNNVQLSKHFRRRLEMLNENESAGMEFAREFWRKRPFEVPSIREQNIRMRRHFPE